MHGQQPVLLGISIHVPLAGDDSALENQYAGEEHFYPRPPCGGRPIAAGPSYFLPNFYPRPPCGGRLVRARRRWVGLLISIHVPLAGDDAFDFIATDIDAAFLSTSPLRGTTSAVFSHATQVKFLSTSPLRGTTVFHSRDCRKHRISIHVPLAGDDDTPIIPAANPLHFYPRPPCGGRPPPLRVRSETLEHFYPRPPCGGRLGQLADGGGGGAISIHVPLAGDDSISSSKKRSIKISIHVPLAGDDAMNAAPIPAITISIHVPLAGDD